MCAPAYRRNGNYALEGSQPRRGLGATIEIPLNFAVRQAKSFIVAVLPIDGESVQPDECALPSLDPPAYMRTRVSIVVVHVGRYTPNIYTGQKISEFIRERPSASRRGVPPWSSYPGVDVT